MNKLKKLDHLIMEVMKSSNLIQEDTFDTSKINFATDVKEMSIKLPRFKITENWGKPGNEDRQLIQKFFNKI